MKNLIIVIATSLTLVSCSTSKESKNNSVAPVQPLHTEEKELQENEDAVEDTRQTQPPLAEEVVVDDSPFELTKTYSGENVMLVYPHGANWGWIWLDGEDGKKLFETLQLKKQQALGNLVWLPSQVKNGYDITCYEQARKDAPNDMVYSCNIYIEYRKGAVSQQEAKIKRDRRAPSLTQSYTGKNLMLVAPHEDKWGWMRIKGSDAKALFYTMDLQETVTQDNDVYFASKVKSGQNIICYQKTETVPPHNVEYSCSLFINYSNGTVDTIRE